MSAGARVRKVVESVLLWVEGPLWDEARLAEDLGADNLDQVELVLALESEFNLEIPDEHVEKLLTVGDCICYVERRLT